MPEHRRRTTPRITTVGGKLAYIAVWWFAGVGLVRLIDLIGVPETMAPMFNSAWDLAFLIVGAQAFRARGEAIDPVRPWWQATGRARASWVLGVLVAIVALTGVVQLILVLLSISADPIYGTWSLVVTTVEWAFVSAFYFNSAQMLKRTGGGAPPIEKFPRPRAGHFANG